jgi:uncharacterized membrane protein YadS
VLRGPVNTLGKAQILSGSSKHRDVAVMYKLIGIILAAIPVVLFLRTIFTKKRSRAVSNFKKQVDYLVWAILFLVACEVIYLVGTLMLN